MSLSWLWTSKSGPAKKSRRKSAFFTSCALLTVSPDDYTCSYGYNTVRGSQLWSCQNKFSYAEYIRAVQAPERASSFLPVRRLTHFPQLPNPVPNYDISNADSRLRQISCQPKPIAVVTKIWSELGTRCRTTVLLVVAPRSTPQNPQQAIRRPCAAIRRRPCVAVVVTVFDPFPHITAHVI